MSTREYVLTLLNSVFKGSRADVGADVGLIPGRRGCGRGFCVLGAIRSRTKDPCGGLHPGSILTPPVSPFCFLERWLFRPVSGATKHDQTMTHDGSCDPMRKEHAMRALVLHATPMGDN